MGLRYIGVLPRKAPKDVMVKAYYYADQLRNMGWTIHTHSILVRDQWNALLRGAPIMKIEACMFILYWHDVWSMDQPKGHVAYALQLAKANEIATFNIGSPKEQLELEALISSLMCCSPA